MKFVLPFSLFVGSSHAFVASSSSPATTTTTTTTTQLDMYRTVEEAIAEAQRICEQDPTSNECRVAWDIVEELEAADSHQGQQSMHADDGGVDTSALVGSFDILTQKIDGKMDQLKATVMALEAMGAPGNMPELARLADEMKFALENARAALRY